jgi:soluble lytic murein transglycosylase-like protein
MARQPGSNRLLLTLALLVATPGAVPAGRADGPGAGPSFSDGSRVPVRRVITYTQEDGVPVFTDRAPADQVYRVMEFSCYACDPGSRVDWRTTPLHQEKFNDVIAAAAAEHGVDSALVRALIHAESGFDPYARSHKGATGLMQLMPGTARDMGVRDILAIQDNIQGGVRYLAMLLQQYGGDITLATAAYNAGPSAVDRYGGVPPFAETQTYVERVRILLDRYRRAI